VKLIQRLAGNYRWLRLFENGRIVSAIRAARLCCGHTVYLWPRRWQRRLP